MALGVLVLDAAAARHRLGDIPAISALCSTDVHSTLANLARLTAGERRAVRSELEAIQRAPGFESWRSWLIEEIRDRLPIWRFAVSRRNRTLAERIRRAAFDFGTEYDASKAVPRRIRAELEAWLQKAITEPCENTPLLAVVKGERYDGKTWLTYQWLLEIAAGSTLPIFFVSSARGSQSDRDLLQYIHEDFAPAFGGADPYTVGSYVRHFRNANSGSGPWALVILDGLNEYENLGWRRHLATALSLGDPEYRPAAVIATVRERSWQSLKKHLPREAGSNLAPFMPPAYSRDWGGGTGGGDLSNLPSRDSAKRELNLAEFSLGTFDEEELQTALTRLGLSPDFLSALSRSALELAHRPRYLGLIAKYFDQLNQYSAVTPEVLHWLDLGDKVGRTREGLKDWGAQKLGEFLRNLARRWRARSFLDLTSVREALGKLTTSVDAVLSDLESEGVLLSDGRRFAVEPERLAMGYGLFLRDALFEAATQKRNLDEALSDLLAPLVDVDETVDALRAAATLALIEGEGSFLQGDAPKEPTEVLDTLLVRWINSRNLRTKDLEAIYQLRRLLWRPLLRLNPELWRESERDCRGRELALMVFGELVEADGEAKASLRRSVRDWFRQIPAKGGWWSRAKARTELGHVDDSVAADAVHARLSHKISEPEAQSLGISISENLDVLSLQSLGLYLAGRAPGLIDPDDLLSFVASRFILEEPIDSGDCWVIRRVLERTPTSWFQDATMKEVGPTNLYARSLLQLVEISERADLEALKPRLRSLVPHERRRRFSTWPTRKNVHSLLQGHIEDGADVRPFAESVRGIVIDPELPKPPNRLGQAIARRVANACTKRRLAYRLDLHDLEQLLPALAAWAPRVGREIVRKTLQNLPADVLHKKRPPLMELRGHAALASGAARRALQETLTLSYRQGKDGWVQQREITLALLPGSGVEETLRLLVDMGDFEHRETFELGGALAEATDLRRLGVALVRARNPERKRRIRILLAFAARSSNAISAALSTIDLPPGEIRAITDTLPSEERISHPQEYLDEITASLKKITSAQAAQQGMWSHRHLPAKMVKHLDMDRVSEWLPLLVPRDGIAQPRHCGLILPTFEWCLDHSDSRAESLWPFVSPFQRQRFSIGILRLSVVGVPWALHLLNRPSADDQMSLRFLRNLILDARNDLEICEISLGACFQDRRRLKELAQELAIDQKAEMRARGVAILGWLVEGAELLRKIQKRDPSRWVRGQAEIALDRHVVDSWAHHWLDQFFAARTATGRWAAGRLFLESADRRVDSWAWKKVRSKKCRKRVRGEAFLLLRAAQDRSKKDDSKLKDHFLGSNVKALDSTVDPWRRDDEWVLAHYGRGD